jgi:hypothetical protein
MYEVRILRNPQFHGILLMMEPEDAETAEGYQAQTSEYGAPWVRANGEAKPAILTGRCEFIPPYLPYHY